MSWNSPLTRWFEAHPWQPVPEEREVVEAPAATEKRSYSLSDPRFWRYFNFGPANLANVDVTTETTLSVPPFFCAVRYISEALAMLDRVVKHRKPDGIHDADTHDLWNFFVGPKPHPHTTWSDFLCALLTNACLGNGYARIHWDYATMRPMYLEHIPMIYCRPEYDNLGNLWYVITGQVGGRTVVEKVPYTDMIHIKGLSLDGVLGYDITMLHQPTLAAGIGRQKHTESVLGKGAHPSLAVQAGEDLDATEVANVEENLMNRIGGAQQSGRPLVLSKGYTVEYLQWSPVDMALEALSNLNVEDVARITKVPRDLLALDTHGTYGAGMQRSKDFLLHCLNPWVEKIQEEFSCKLFYYSESAAKKVWFEFDTSMYVALDKEAESKILVEQVAGSVRTPNEARMAIGLPPLPGGDELLVDINLLPISKAVEVALAKYLSSEGEKAKGKQEEAATSNNQTDLEDEPEPKPEP